MMLTKPKTITDHDNSISCIFCKSPEVDEVNLGPIYTFEGVACHYYCMLMSAALSQNGTDDEGIQGFMPMDIMKEVRRASRLKCSYCHTGGASVGCCRKSCKRAYHFPCGLKCGVNYQFHGNYEAFCKEHATPQQIHIKYRDWKCPICMCRVIQSDEPIVATCCNGAVFHKVCLKVMALNAGYFFKCPMCNANKVFTQEMRHNGVFVPEQDASWEREPNAFQELLFQYSKCDAEVCLSTKGREYNAAKGGFILARCRICGAAGVHRQCGNLKTVANWACIECFEVEKKTEEDRANKMLENPESVIDDYATAQRNTAPTQPRRRVSKPTQAALQSRAHRNYDDCEEVDLEKVKISPYCFAYFPYSKNNMKEFQQNRVSPVVPDWRNYVLRSNVVDWLGEHMRNVLKLPIPPPRGLKRTISKGYPEVKLFRPEIKTEITELNVPWTNGGPSVKSGKKRRSNKPRSSRWRRGVLSKRKGQKKKIQISTVDSQSELNLSVNSSLPITQAIKLEPIDSEEPQVTDNILEPISDDHIFKVPYPVKKRKIHELGDAMSDSETTKDSIAQSNLEIVDIIKVEHVEHEEVEIDHISTRPLESDDLENINQDGHSEKNGNGNGVHENLVDSRFQTLPLKSVELEKIKHEDDDLEMIENNGNENDVHENLVDGRFQTLQSQLDENEVQTGILLDHDRDKTRQEIDSLNQCQTFESTNGMEELEKQGSCELETLKSTPESDKTYLKESTNVLPKSSTQNSCSMNGNIVDDGEDGNHQ